MSIHNSRFFFHRLNIVKRNLDNLGQNIAHLFAISEVFRILIALSENSLKNQNIFWLT